MFMATAGWPDFSLLDSGAGRKLERYGKVTIIRPEPQALWHPALPASAWEQADAVFTSGDEEEHGRWKLKPGAPDEWVVAYQQGKFLCKFAGFRHVGIFPDQQPQWDWILEKCQGRQLKVLNLFAYTGVISVLAAQAGAQVTHVDSAPKGIEHAKQNQTLSGLATDSIRWICEDARKFVAREVRRGARYDGIILDPPQFGRGSKGEVWKLFDDLPVLLTDCVKLLGKNSSFMMLTAYSIRASYLSLHGLMQQECAALDGSVDSGELAVKEQSGGRMLGTALYSRWQSS